MIAVLVLGALLTQADDLTGLLRQLDEDDPSVRDAASRAIRRRGPRVIPDLERALGHSSPEVRYRVEEILQRFPERRLCRVLQSPGFPEARRRWNAVIDAVVGKRPIPAAVWKEVDGEVSELREQTGPRPHEPGEVVTALQESATQALRKLIWRVGVEGRDVELSGGGMESVLFRNDLLTLVLRAEPDSVTFEEVYGTLRTLQFEGVAPVCESWGDDDRQIAIDVLVQIRRRPDLPPLSPGLSRDGALQLALNGPIVEGLVQFLGRAFADRECRKMMRQEVEWQKKDDSGPSALRDVYDVLLGLNQEIEPWYDASDPSMQGMKAVPDRVAPVPERHLQLFNRVKGKGMDDAAERVVRDLLSNLGPSRWEAEELATVEVLLRTIADRVAERSR